MSLLEHFLKLDPKEFKTLSDEQKERLNRDLPSQALKPHPTKSYLTSINAAFLFDTLNEVFGISGWLIDAVTSKAGGKINEKSGEQIVAKVELMIPEYGIYRMSYGGNDNVDIGDAYKGAVTDATTKICSTFMNGVNKVWKNEAGKPSANSTPETPKLPWLSIGSNEIETVIQDVKNKKYKNIQEIELKYRLNTQVKNILTQSF